MKRAQAVSLAILGLTLLLPAWSPVPAMAHKQARSQLKVAVKDMLKEQKQDQVQAFASLKVCLETLRAEAQTGTPPPERLEPLRDCVATFVEHVAMAEYDNCLHLMERAGKLLGQVDQPPNGFVRGDGGIYDKALNKARTRTRKRLDRGLKLIDKTIVVELARHDYEVCIRVIVPDLDGGIPTVDGVITDLRPSPVVTVMVAGSSPSVANDGLLFVAGFSYDPDWVPQGDVAPSLDAVQLQCREGQATVLDVPLYALHDGPVGVENPPIRWSAGFSQLDGGLLTVGGLPEGNVLVRAVQNDVVGTATIGIP